MSGQTQSPRSFSSEADGDDRTLAAADGARDASIANAIAARLSAVGIVPANRLRIAYHRGTATISGLLDWQFQRQAVLDHLRRHPAIKHIIDEVEVRPLLDPALLMQRIDSATRAHGDGPLPLITVDIDGARVTLRGRVVSEALKGLAETAAWATPGVGAVENRISVG